MNKVLYYANVSLLPLFFVITLVINSYKMLKQAFRWTVGETKTAYRSNRRVFKMD